MRGGGRPFGLVPIDRETRNARFLFIFRMFFWGVSILVLSFFLSVLKEEDGDQTPRVWGNPTDSTTF
jgi:hypothetical protein